MDYVISSVNHISHVPSLVKCPLLVSVYNCSLCINTNCASVSFSVK